MELKRLTGCRMFPPISWQPMQAYSNSLAPLEKGCAKDTAVTKSKTSFKLEVLGERVKGTIVIIAHAEGLYRKAGEIAHLGQKRGWERIKGEDCSHERRCQPLPNSKGSAALMLLGAGIFLLPQKAPGRDIIMEHLNK